MFFMSNMSKIFRCLFSVRICTIFSPSSLSGTTIIYCLYYYSSSIHFRDHLAIILNVTVGFLSLLYLVLFTPIVLISFLLSPFCQLSPRRRLFKLCTRRVYNLYIHIVHKIADLTTKIKLFLLISIFFCQINLLISNICCIFAAGNSKKFRTTCSRTTRL